MSTACSCCSVPQCTCALSSYGTVVAQPLALLTTSLVSQTHAHPPATPLPCPLQNAALVAEAGANALVAGTTVFAGKEPPEVRRWVAAALGLRRMQRCMHEPCQDGCPPAGASA